MAISKKQVEDATKPVTPKDMAKAGFEAEQVSKKIQKQFKSPDAPIVTLNAYQRGVASLPARQAEYQRRSEFVPKVAKTVGDVEKAQTQIQDELSDFYDKWNLQADQLAMKQSQAEKEADLAALQSQYGVEDKLRKIEFDAYKNASDRYDALEKAYLDGDATRELIRAGINGQVRVQDIDMYWDLVINDIKQDLADFESMTRAEFEAWKEEIGAKAKNWGAITSGLTNLAKVGIDAMGKKDSNGLTGWDKVDAFFADSGDGMSAADQILATPDEAFLEPNLSDDSFLLEPDETFSAEELLQ